jgi:hypothetical protein
MGGIEKGFVMLDCAFDPLAVAVDWLDACRSRNLVDLLSLYDENAMHQCACDGGYAGSEDLARYWSVRLARAVPHAFGLIDLAWKADGEPSVLLDHVGFDGEPIRVDFRFTNLGRIWQTICGPARPCPETV